MSARDENRHLDIKREVNFRMPALIDRYWQQYGSKKKSQDLRIPAKANADSERNANGIPGRRRTVLGA